jgi:hypothetical protein
VRRALLAHLLRTKSEESEGDEEEDTGEETGGEGRELVRALIASKILRRRKVRRAILIHLLKAKAETEFEGSDETESEGDEETGDEGGGEEREIVRALIASKMLRRRRVRRALLTHLLREKEEAVA